MTDLTPPQWSEAWDDYGDTSMKEPSDQSRKPIGAVTRTPTLAERISPEYQLQHGFSSDDHNAAADRIAALEAAIQAHRDANLDLCDNDACQKGCGHDRRLYAVLDGRALVADR